MATKARGGQSMVELALGMFALALVLLVTFGFADCIVRSLNAQRELRGQAGADALLSGMDGQATYSERVRLDSLTAKWIFGKDEVKMRESVYLPAAGGIGK